VEEIRCLFDRFSTPIHEGHWLSQDNLLRIDTACFIEGPEAFGTDRKVAYFGETIHYLKPNIVPAHSIRSSRIAQSYDDLHIRLFFFLLLFLLLLYLRPLNGLRSHCLHNFLLHHRRHDRRNRKVSL